MWYFSEQVAFEQTKKTKQNYKFLLQFQLAPEISLQEKCRKTFQHVLQYFRKAAVKSGILDCNNRKKKPCEILKGLCNIEDCWIIMATLCICMNMTAR